MTIAPPFAYFGGKTTLAQRIADLLPPHEHYVEPYCGGSSVLLAKPPSIMETVNDLDQRLMTFWRVLRNRRRVWVRLSQGRGGSQLPTGWRYYVNPNGSSVGMPAYLSGYVERMTAVTARLQRVSLESRPALELIERFGVEPSVLMYVDPPYLGTSRRSDGGHGYLVEMKDPDAHRRLAAALTSCRSAVVLSGYDNALYDELYAGWDRTELRAFNGNAARDRTVREVLWSNRPLTGQHLFSEVTA